QPETAEICRAALKQLQEAGAELVDVEIGNLAKHYELASFDIALYETKRDLALYLERYAPGVTLADVIGQIASADVRETLEPLLDETFPISDERYQQALLVHRAALRQIYQDMFDRHRLTALAFPTVPMPALPLDQDIVDLPSIGPVPVFLAMIHNTGPGSTAGIPGISMPAGRTAEGMPVGLAFDGPEGGDKALLEFAIAAGAIMG
ncbi:MAG: indole acetamide hydrolase, partial [Pseudomonadota bacterium]